MAEVLEFNQQVNLGGVGPVDVMQQDPPGGPYEVEILATRQVTKEGEGGKTSLRYNVAVVEDGPAKGISTQVVIGTDWSKPFNVGHLKNCLLGLHNPAGQFSNPEKLNAVVNVTPAMFKGNRAYIFVKSPPAGEVDEQGRPVRADKNFITREMYDAAKRAMTLGGGAPAAAAPAARPAPANNSPKPAGAADLGNLFG